MPIPRLGALLALIALLGPMAGCSRPQFYQSQSYVFGTLVQVSVQGRDRARAQRLVGHVLHQFDTLNRQWHAWHPSELTRLDAAFAQGPQPVPLPPGLGPMLADATRFSLRSGGLFDPAIGKLIRLWGFEADTFRPVRPDPAEIARLVRAHPEMTDIHVQGQTVYSTNPQVRLDFGGYKGYALDLAARYLRAHGVTSALINIGGNIQAIGRHGGRSWRVGIQDPRRPGPIAVTPLRDGESIGTSGDYERYFILDGKRYCHIIDPRTGYPAQGVESVTVIAPPGPLSGALSDAASKPIFIAGTRGWRAAARRMGIKDVMLIDDRGQVYLTQSMARRLHFVEKGLILHVVP
ncbi:MAG: FAD:protein FMN transferase [Betaproteobacteria bacterium]|nr:FAD:protein FMN transferase [Betaproteobacteria bacterium]